MGESERESEKGQQGNAKAVGWRKDAEFNNKESHQASRIPQAGENEAKRHHHNDVILFLIMGKIIWLANFFLFYR